MKTKIQEIEALRAHCKHHLAKLERAHQQQSQELVNQDIICHSDPITWAMIRLNDLQAIRQEIETSKLAIQELNACISLAQGTSSLQKSE